MLTLHALINIYSSHLVALFNNISVWWHVAGVAVIIVDPRSSCPTRTRASSFVFTETINNSGFGQGMFWFYVLPLGFLLTHVHDHRLRRLGAHLRGDARRGRGGPEGRLALGLLLRARSAGSLLLAITFAATDVDAINEGAGGSLAVLDSALSATAAEIVILISPHRPAVLRHGLRHQRARG